MFDWGRSRKSKKVVIVKDGAFVSLGHAYAGHTNWLRPIPANMFAANPHLIAIQYGAMDERAYYNETSTTKPITLNCPSCRTAESYDLRWLVRTKKDRLPPGGDERDRAKFLKWQSYMVLVDDKVMCKNMRCRKRFDISGVKTTAYI